MFTNTIAVTDVTLVTDEGTVTLTPKWSATLRVSMSCTRVHAPLHSKNLCPVITHTLRGPRRRYGL